MFETENAALALALLTAGCEPLSFDEGGPAVNIYTPSILRGKKLGIGRPISEIEEVVKEAVRRGITGVVKYRFTQDDKLNRCILAWDKMKERISKAEKGEASFDYDSVSDEDVMRTMCIGLENRQTLKHAAFLRSPMIGHGECHTVKTDKGTHLSGSGKFWSLNLNPAAKKKLQQS